jgi:3',5'-cyclic AMP phosphodiesterase CpdA
MKNRSRLAFLAVVMIAACMFIVLWPKEGSVEEVSSKTELALKGLSPAESGAVRIAAIGDVRSGDENQLHIAKLLEQVYQKAPLEAIILLGDNASLHGDPAGALENTFTRPYAALVQDQVPFYAVLGNHDLRRGMREQQLGFSPYHMDGRPYFSRIFGNGLVEAFFLDSNTITKDTEQLQWLEKALAESGAQWKIVAMHHPLYSTVRHRRASRSLMLALEPIFRENGVALVLTGHNHIYERLRPIDGITFITAGSGGELRKGELQPGNFLRAAGNDTDNVALILEFTPDSCRFLAYTADGSLADAGALQKERTAPEKELAGGK